MHGRPADLFVRAANQFDCDLTVRNISSDSVAVNGKSILRILSLGVYHGHVIHVMADGTDEEKAIQVIARLVRSNFRQSPKARI